MNFEEAFKDEIRKLAMDPHEATISMPGGRKSTFRTSQPGGVGAPVITIERREGEPPIKTMVHPSGMRTEQQSSGLIRLMPRPLEAKFRSKG